MRQPNKISNLDVVILCGGKGTRLRTALIDRPKPLAEITGKPFLDFLLDILASYKFRRVILSVGYLKEKIIEHFRREKRKDIKIEFSSEDKPLGTGGAVKKAKPLIKSEQFLVMNGDCFCPVDFKKFHETHLARKTLLSMALTRISDASDYGKVELNESGKIINFNEKKSSQKNALINAGIYLMKKDIFDFLPKRSCFSLEYDFFPKIILTEPCYGFIVDGQYFDIGTPERYKKAVELFSSGILNKV